MEGGKGIHCEVIKANVLDALIQCCERKDRKVVSLYNCFTCAMALGNPALMMCFSAVGEVTPWWRERLTTNLAMLIV